MAKKNKHSAFTLSEVLIVVAIIAVLVAISAPLFSQALVKARAATCAANRRNIYAEMTEAYLVDEHVNLDEVFSEFRERNLCPDGGSLSYAFNHVNKQITVNCSFHNGSLGPDLFALLNEKEITVGSGTRVDSTKSGSLKTQILAALSEAGIDISAMGAQTWAISNSPNPFTTVKNAPTSPDPVGRQLIWSDTSMDTLESLSSSTIPNMYKVRVMCYNADWDTYIVGYSNVILDDRRYIISKSSETNGYGTGNGNDAEYFESYDDAYDKFLTLNQYALK